MFWEVSPLYERILPAGRMSEAFVSVSILSISLTSSDESGPDRGWGGFFFISFIIFCTSEGLLVRLGAMEIPFIRMTTNKSIRLDSIRWERDQGCRRDLASWLSALGSGGMSAMAAISFS